MTFSETLQSIVKLFVSKTVVELSALQDAIGGVTERTVFRHLKHIAYRRSYNHNGRYYTLFEKSRFGPNGLWSWKGIHFSMDGSLRNTAQRFIRQAKSGMTQRELRDRLGVRVHNTLLDLLRKGDIGRQLVNSIYVYLHPDHTTQKTQLRCRRELLAPETLVGVEITESIVIHVLLVLVRHPGSQPADVVRRLHGHSPPISFQQVKAVFTRYELGEKKGLSIS